MSDEHEIAKIVKIDALEQELALTQHVLGTLIAWLAPQLGYANSEQLINTLTAGLGLEETETPSDQ